MECKITLVFQTPKLAGTFCWIAGIETGPAGFKTKRPRSDSGHTAKHIPGKKVRRTHRCDHISLLHFCPGEVLQELVVRRAAKV